LELAERVRVPLHEPHEEGVGEVAGDGRLLPLSPRHEELGYLEVRAQRELAVDVRDQLVQLKDRVRERDVRYEDDARLHDVRTGCRLAYGFNGRRHASTGA
jgi:hypothetical protein